MKRNFIALAGASMLALAGTAAAETVELSDAQMDGVTAGATASFNFATAALGDYSTTSLGQVVAVADTGPGGLNPTVPGLDYASVQLLAGSLAISVMGPAVSQTAGSIGATLP